MKNSDEWRNRGTDRITLAAYQGTNNIDPQ